jgi:hypothetical protein
MDLKFRIMAIVPSLKRKVNTFIVIMRFNCELSYFMYFGWGSFDIFHAKLL